MAICFLCREEADTRKLFTGSARGFADICFDCAIKFYKLKKEER
jgi:hypothetical protein